jgi:hypothetical protein
MTESEHSGGRSLPGANQVEYGELPELTRALRAIGSSRRSAGALQSMFFRPLLDARRRAEEARTAAARISAFDAVALREALAQCVDRILADWPDARESARRAIRAELIDRVRVYGDALDRLAERARAAVEAHDTERLGAWREWTMQLQVTFQCADRSWLALRSVVDALPARKPGQSG